LQRTVKDGEQVRKLKEKGKITKKCGKKQMAWGGGSEGKRSLERAVKSGTITDYDWIPGKKRGAEETRRYKKNERKKIGKWGGLVCGNFFILHLNAPIFQIKLFRDAGEEGY